jgi:hypothetical protein
LFQAFGGFMLVSEIEELAILILVIDDTRYFVRYVRGLTAEASIMEAKVMIQLQA